MLSGMQAINRSASSLVSHRIRLLIGLRVLITGAVFIQPQSFAAPEKGSNEGKVLRLRGLRNLPWFVRNRLSLPHSGITLTLHTCRCLRLIIPLTAS
jgi:hypothetical protein